jgi:hypothetical protein
MKTYKLYQFTLVNNVALCTFVAQTDAPNMNSAEVDLLKDRGDDNVEYIITVTK